jgi:RNA polymerase sigma factor (sigma-70 family)
MQVTPELIADCILLKRKSQRELYDRCFSFMMGICYRYTNNIDDAKALVNLGFLKVLKSLATHNTERSFEGWLRRIMVNTIIDEYRKNVHEKEMMQYHDPEELIFYEPAFSLNRFEHDISVEQIEVFMKRLPAMSSRVFNLFAIDGYSHREIAELLGMSEGTSRWHVATARESLKKMITEFIEKKRSYESAR